MKKVKTRGYIYLTTNHHNRVLRFYIGKKHQDEFDQSYRGSGKRILKALSHFKDEWFTTILIKRAFSKKELDDLEELYIDQYRKKYGEESVYNISKGRGGGPHKKELKELMRKIKLGKKVLALRGLKRTKEQRERIRISLIGRKLSEEHKDKIIKSLRGNKRGQGSRHTQEWKDRMSMMQKGRIKSPKEIENIKKAWARRRREGTATHSKEARMKISLGKMGKPWSPLRRRVHELSKQKIDTI